MAGAERAGAVVLVSGGMDSCVAAAMAARDGAAFFLHAGYGQRTERKERACFEALADHYKAARRLVVRLDHLGAMGGSALTDAAVAVPGADLSRRGVPVTYVPFRNAQLLAAAVAWAETLDASRVVIGAVEEDSSGYPDCRRVFYEAFQRVIDTGTRAGAALRLETPLIGLRKSAIVARGADLGAPFHLTWSCYRAEDAACGACDSCALRLRAFGEAGLRDPLPYRPVGA
ncbi:MAG TPA: 7-cyano-7-deazaguanine synthase [Candidatus Polarisedimenticolia bacterium]|nr:7-cyano-7-deazaguanine synthase [Candidatus Polarisedimenticolia bacterium]